MVLPPGALGRGRRVDVKLQSAMGQAWAVEGLKVTSGNQGPNLSPGRKRAGEAIPSLWGKTGPVGDWVQGPKDHIMLAAASGPRGYSVGAQDPWAKPEGGRNHPKLH